MNDRQPADASAGEPDPREVAPADPAAGAEGQSLSDTDSVAESVPPSQPDGRSTHGVPGAPVRPSDVLPKVAAEDDPKVWGDKPSDNYDDWLREQRPPHWG